MKKKTPIQMHKLCAKLLAITATMLIFVSVARADYKSTVLADQPVGYWPLDLSVDTGGSATDLSGNGNNGSYINIVSPGNEVPGPSAAIPNGVSFDGATTYVDLSTGPDTSVLNFAGQITMEAWVQPASSQIAGNYANIIAKGWDFTNYSEIELSDVTSDLFRCGRMNGVYISYGTVTTNWTYLVSTYDGTNWNLYVNGQLTGSIVDGAGSLILSDPWAIGNGSEGGAAYGGRIFTGNICQAALYSHALTPAQVAEHYYAGLHVITNQTPVIISQPMPVVVYSNALASFSVVAYSASPLSYQWWNGLSQLAGQTNASLTITHAQVMGNYTVVITNIFGAVTSSVANLALVTAPTNSIGFNFTFSPAFIGAGNGLVLAPSAAAGVTPAVNWNNLVAANPSSANATWNSFNDSSGAAIPATLTVSGVNDGAILITGDTNCANAGLMYDFWRIASTTPVSSVQDSGISCTLSNLSPGAVYNVYVYLPNNDGAKDSGHVTANGGNTRYYFYEDDAEYGPLWTCTAGLYDGTPDNNPAGTYAVPVNYIEIPGTVVARDGTLTVILTLEGGTADTPSLGIAGLQLVPTPPVTVATPPASESIYTNGVGSFSVVVTNGVQPFAYQWYVVSGGVSNAIAGATSAIYHTPPATVNGNGYFAVVSDSLGTEVTSSTATLTLAAGSPSVISVQLMPYNNGLLNGVQPLLPTDQAGAFPATNWNSVAVNTANNGASQAFYSLIDQNSTGSGVPLTVVGAGSGDVISSPAPDSAPITKLLNSFVKTTGGRISQHSPMRPTVDSASLHFQIWATTNMTSMSI